MSYFFSQQMTYCSALLPIQVAWDVLNELGKQRKVQIQTQTINYDSPFINNYRRCDELLSKIAMIKSILQQYHKYIKFELKQIQTQAQVWKLFHQIIIQKHIEQYLYINHVEEDVLQAFHFLSNQINQIQNLNKNIEEIISNIAMLFALKQYGKFQRIFKNNSIQLQEQINRSFNSKNSSFGSRCICLNRNQLLLFKKSLFRITKGNCCIEDLQLKQIQLYQFLQKQQKDALLKILQQKIICFIVYPTGQRGILQNKINKLLNGTNCQILTSSLNNLNTQLQKMKNKLNQIHLMEHITIQGVKKHISKLAQSKQGFIGSWIYYLQIYIRKQRQIYMNLSNMRVSRNLVKFNMYIPSKQLPLNIQPKSNFPPLILNVIQNQKMPPSKFDTNIFLQIPQQIVNTYGIPSYQEINPAPFYIVTFAFFIGVMFGDIGHMLLAIPLLIYLKANIWFWIVVFFMGYCGLIYNQFFGLNFGLFSSCFKIFYSGNKQFIQPINNCVYAIGIDSIWKVADNQMQFVNSLKMKIAVIIAVVHMMFGLGIKFYNNIKQKKIINLFTNTIPQIIFLLCTFAYMDYLIIYKWNTSYPQTQFAPSIISTMISVFVNMAQQNEEDLLFWSGQRKTQKMLVIIAFMCIPVMLFAKTIITVISRKKINIQRDENNYQEQLAQQHIQIQMQEYKKQKNSNDYMIQNSDRYSKQNGVMKHDESIKQMAVHQFIQTIQFVLGTVSNTASYLRLWALSLAHAQLSSVIFELTVLKVLLGGYSSIIGILIIFPMFLGITFGVLICMDTMQCFLHSLRLHWVEFQNKFYQGKGRLFKPFSFQKIN